MIRIFLIILGTFFVGLAFLGVVLPLLPTTPFLLLAAACYARSSDKFYNWLMTNRLFGEYIRNYRAGKGIPVKTKILAISLLWLTIGYSTIFVISVLIGKVSMMLIAAGVSWHLTSLPSYPRTRVSSSK
ncbi:MAG: YbaN family protein [bacterium]